MIGRYPPGLLAYVRGLLAPVAKDCLLGTPQKRVGGDPSAEPDAPDGGAHPVAPGGVTLGQGATAGSVFRNGPWDASKDSSGGHALFLIEDP